MTIKTIATTILLSCVCSLSAQMDFDVVQPDYGESFTFAGKYNLQNWNPEKDYYEQFLANAKMEGSNVRGDKYLSSDFSEGVIINRKNNTKAEAKIRYNIYNQTFEILINENDNTYKKLNKSYEYEFLLNGEKFILLDNHLLNSDLPENKFGYIVELVKSDSKASLYKKYQLQFEIGYWGSNNHYSKKDDSKITDVQVYYIMIDNEYKKVELNKKRIGKNFDNFKSEIKEFIKYKGFNFRGNDEKIDQELIQVIRYYNSL